MSEKLSLPTKQVNAVDVPKISKGKSREKYLAWLKALPLGKSYIITMKDIDITYMTIKAIVGKLVKEKVLPNSYRAIERTVGKEKILYVVNSNA